MREYTAEMSGSGQFAKCAHCKKDPIIDGCEVYDGCLGKLDTVKVMNACCGHGEIGCAYVQSWDGSCVRGEEAVTLQVLLKVGRGSNERF